jgi:DNA repair protein RecN (Recombination protein N)
VPGEEAELDAEEDVLADALAHREAAEGASELVAADGGAADRLARAAALLEGRTPFGEVADRLRALAVEAADAAVDLRNRAESIEPDEERLAEVRSRRQRLVELRRKYGERIEDVIAFAGSARARLDELASLDTARARVQAELDAAAAELAEVAARLGAARRAAAPGLATAVEEVLASLAMSAARVEVAVADTADLPGAGEAVELRLATNPGGAVGGLARVASGGELSRVMLALRLVLSGGPPSMVFDEVDAGVGGETALAVGRSLADLSAGRQVLVVTHLPQVAAFADHQLRVEKRPDGATTVTTVDVLGPEERVVELSRMLSGSPGSATARDHAQELLAAARTRVRP